MNTHHDTTDLDDTLRWQLRALRRDEAPSRDLWAGIAPVLAGRGAAHRHRPWRVPAIAAGLLLAAGVLGWWQAMDPPSAPGASQTLVQREARDLTLQYQAALQELAPVAPAGSLQPTFAVLDRNAALIREALEQAPDSRLLLEQLRRTYAHRLALVQRVAYS